MERSYCDWPALACSWWFLVWPGHNLDGILLLNYYYYYSYFWPTLIWQSCEAVSGYNKRRWGSTAASLTQCGQAVWWSQVAGSGPWWYRWPASLMAFSVVGLSGKGWSLVGRASDRLRRGCTPAPEPPPHSGAPGSLSDTHRYVAGCRSHGSGRGAGSQLKRESTDGDQVFGRSC